MGIFRVKIDSVDGSTKTKSFGKQCITLSTKAWGSSPGLRIYILKVFKIFTFKTDVQKIDVDFFKLQF